MRDHVNPPPTNLTGVSGRLLLEAVPTLDWIEYWMRRASSLGA